MLKSELIKIDFDSSALTVCATVTPECVESFSNPPDDFLHQAVSFMEKAREEGKVSVYQVYQSEWKIAWQRLHHTHDRFTFRMTLAAGTPKLPGVQVDASLENPNIGALLTIESGPEVVTSWNPSWLVMWVKKEAERKGIVGNLSESSIRLAWWKFAVNRQAVARFPIRLSTKINPRHLEKVYFVKNHSEGQDIELIIGDIVPLADHALVKTLIEEVHGEARNLALTPGAAPFHIVFEKNLREAIAAAIEGPQRLFIDLPLCIPAAFPMFWDEKKPDNPVLKPILIELSRLPKTQPRADWVSEKIWPRFDNTLIDQTWLELRNLGLIDVSLNNDAVHTTPGLCAQHIRREVPATDPYFRNMLQFARESIETLSSSRRDVQAMTLTLSDQEIELIEELASKFRRQIVQLAGEIQGEPAEVFQLGFQLFPLTHSEPMLLNNTEMAQAASDHLGKEWCHVIIREMVGLQGFDADPKWIAGRLCPPATLAEIGTAFTSLIDSKMVYFDKSEKRYVQAARNLMAQEKVTGSQVVKFHQTMLDLAMHSMGWRRRRGHDFSSFLFAAPFEAMRPLSQEVKTFLQSVFDIAANCKRATSVHQVNIQLFTLTSPHRAK